MKSVGLNNKRVLAEIKRYVNEDAELVKLKKDHDVTADDNKLYCVLDGVLFKKIPKQGKDG